MHASKHMFLGAFIATQLLQSAHAAPVVYLTRPTNGASYAVGSPILVGASASGSNATLSNLDFVAGTNFLRRFFGPLTNGVYNFWWTNVTAGTYQVRAEARDNTGGSAVSATAQITVTNVPVGNMVPVVTWIRPTNGAVLPPGTPITLTASATDADGTISHVEFFRGTVYLGRGVKIPTNSNYNWVWTNPPPGIFQLHAEAVDNAGARGTSTAVQIGVGAGAGGMVDLGIVETSTLGHAFLNPNVVPPEILPQEVVDYLVDQDQSSGGGGLLPDVSVNWDTNSQFKLTVSAPDGMRFLVTTPAGRVVKFGGFLLWESTRGGFSDSGQVTAHFTDLEGTAPEFSESDSVLSDSHGYFGFIDLEGTGVTNSFSFSAITLTGTVGEQYTGNGTENYLPHLDSSLRLYYSTTDTEDPGNFVSIVPTGPLPIIRMKGVSAQIGVDLVVYGRPGRTHIVECSTDTASWTAISSGVMPPAAAMHLTDATATPVGSRFYRVVELP